MDLYHWQCTFPGSARGVLIVTVLELVGGAPAQGWGGDTARPRDRAASFITAYCPVPLTVRGTQALTVRGITAPHDASQGNDAILIDTSTSRKRADALDTPVRK